MSSAPSPSPHPAWRLAGWWRGLRRWFGGGAAADAAAQAAAPPRASHSARAAAAPATPRRRGAFEAQADAVEMLRRLAHTDDATGLPNRRYFLGRLTAVLSDSNAAGCSLLLVRVLQLDTLAKHAGDELTARWLAVLADVLAAYPQHVAGAFAGRLNESDFGLCLPASGVADETAGTLLRTLRATPAAGPGAAELVIGAIDGLRSANVGDALAAADQALARAEAAGPFCIEIHRASDADPAPLGERAWRVRIDEALHEGRAGLAEFPVLGADGELLHLECPLRVQLEAGAPFSEARQWLAMAARGRLLPRVDLMALDLALVAISRDGVPRGVHVSASSLVTAGFVGEVQRRLEAAPAAARALWVEVADGVALDRALPRLREAGIAWRRHGVRLGVEHAGASMHGLARLAGVGLDHVKVEARFVRGAGSEPVVREFATALVALVHGMGLQVIAEGIDDAADLKSLWTLGFDAATGPAVKWPEPALA